MNGNTNGNDNGNDNGNTGRAEISPGRQLLYYLGMALTAIGLLMFFSVFLTAFSSGPSLGDFPFGGSPSSTIVTTSPGSEAFFPATNRSSQWPPPEWRRAIFGFGLIFVGGILMNLGRAGLRGSGVILDPHGARDDLKPWSQAAGGMLDDALSSSHVVGQALERNDDKPREIVRVRCPNCRTLNDEDAKFCDNCGAVL